MTLLKVTSIIVICAAIVGAGAFFLKKEHEKKFNPVSLQAVSIESQSGPELKTLR